MYSGLFQINEFDEVVSVITEKNNIFSVRCQGSYIDKFMQMAPYYSHFSVTYKFIYPTRSVKKMVSL